ncbi:MAG TPA: metalloregulator ArsR/SmtB family transcription factor [Candidatus Eisenbacteria bacterium]|nr:metalloregulator ArsR/SmtB family transcription factor [Candidatus Eisenbacteria bacterium]
MSRCAVRHVNQEDVRRARSQLAGDRTYVDLSRLFAALADTTRVKLVHVLLRQELCTCDLAATLGVSESATSQHLRLLKALRLVESRRAGRVVYHSLDDAHIAALVRVGLLHLGHATEASRLDQEAGRSRTA